MQKVILGQKVKDIISGFEGIAISCTSYLHGCNRWSVSPTILKKDGQCGDNEVFDEPQLTVIGDGVCKEIKKSDNIPPGGDHDVPNPRGEPGHVLILESLKPAIKR